MSASPEKINDLSFKRLAQIKSTLAQEVRGAEAVVDDALAALLAGGHVLLEGPPGVGKTSLAKAFSRVFAGSVSRIQMTSDLLPAEIVGVLRPNLRTHELEFRPGPLFANFVLADELNRCGPKTQAALLEAMAEGTVTVDGKTYPLPQPFFVMATQNPFESQGVYPLAESQLDRFSIHLEMKFPAPLTEKSIFADSLRAAPVETTRKIFDAAVLPDLRREVEHVHVEESILNYLINVVHATRTHPRIKGGVSVRAGLQFAKLARALAYVRGRGFVLVDDVQDLAPGALGHRLILQDGEADLPTKRAVITELLSGLKAPR